MSESLADRRPLIERLDSVIESIESYGFKAIECELAILKLYVDDEVSKLERDYNYCLAANTRLSGWKGDSVEYGKIIQKYEQQIDELKAKLKAYEARP